MLLVICITLCLKYYNKKELIYCNKFISYELIYLPITVCETNATKVYYTLREHNTCIIFINIP